jgi:DNA polymerase III alpha subunit
VADVIARVKEVGWTTAPIADRTSTFAFVNWTRACREAGLRPVYGVELAVVKAIGPRASPDFWTFLAKDRLRPLHDLIWQATNQGGRDACLTYDQALSAPGVFKVAGERLRVDCLPPAMGLPGDFYVGLRPSTPAGLFRAARRAGIPFLAALDNYYPRAGDRETYRVMLGERASIQTYPQHVLSDDEWRGAVLWHVAPADAEAALLTRGVVLASCRAELRRATLLSPKKERTLRELCEAGAARIGVDLSGGAYRDRLEVELRTIDEKDFADYFHILADVVTWSRKRMLVGPARGSSAGSLVCFLTGITTVDPLKYDLVFERFIDANRSDPPDVDVDFSDRHRDEAFQYVIRKYGAESVAKLGSVATFQPKSALNQAAISLRVPSRFVDEVARVLIHRSQGDNRASATLEDTLKDTEPGRRMLADYPEMIVAARVEDFPVNAGTHAAGVVLTEGSVRDYVAVDARTGTTMCDKHDAEELNLLKVDALGLSQLSVFERALELIGKKGDYEFLDRIPLDDPAAFDVINHGKFAGVFSFGPGTALARLARDACSDAVDGRAFTSLEDVIAFTALVRPGPLTSGETTKWIARRVGKERVTYASPILEPYLAPTFGVFVYQEQVMRICRDIGEMSWDDVNVLRRAMSRSYGKEFFDRFKAEFDVGAEKKLPPEVIENLWADMVQFGAMGFNRAHAVSYGLISYWCCWLKAHHPVEFAAASLDAEAKNPGTQLKMLRELDAEGVSYVPVDPARSTDRWEIARQNGSKHLVGPLGNVVGLGPIRVANILTCRNMKPPRSPPSIEAKILQGARTKIDSLWPVREAIARLYPDGLRTLDGTKPMDTTRLADVHVGIDRRIICVGVVAKATQNDLNSLQYVMKRRGEGLIERYEGPTMTLSVILQDDTDDLFCWIGRWEFDKFGRDVIERARIGKTLYAFKGTVPPNARRMLRVFEMRYLGEVDA